MNYIKRITAALLLLLMLAALSACSEVPAETVVVTPEGATPSPVATTSPSPSPAPSDTPLENKFVVHSGDAWGDYGYVHFLCPQTGEWSFTALDSGDIAWKIYLLDAEFDDAERFIPQVYECALEGDGTLSVTEGQYIYIYCTANSWTGLEATEQARMECTLVTP